MARPVFSECRKVTRKLADGGAAQRRASQRTGFLVKRDTANILVTCGTSKSVYNGSEFEVPRTGWGEEEEEAAQLVTGWRWKPEDGSDLGSLPFLGGTKLAHGVHREEQGTG